MAEASRRLVLSLLFLFIAGGLARADAAVGPCGPRAQYEGYRLRDVRLESPFPFVRVVRGLMDSLRAMLPAPGTLFREARIDRTVTRLTDAVTEAPVLAYSPAAVTAVMAYADRCDDEAREIDLVFYVFTTRLTAPASFSREAREMLRRDPATAVQPSTERLGFLFEPRLRFDESDHLVPGVRASVFDPSSGFRLSGDAAGSDEYRSFGLLASGTHLFEHPALWQASYGAGYRYEKQPVENESLRQGFGFAWASAATRPLLGLNAPLRYGAQFEHGFQESGIVSRGFDSDTSYSALKLLSGISGGRGRHDYSLSLGLGLGATDRAAPAWSKVLFDAVYAVRVVPQTEFFDHRALDLEARGTAGWLIPLGSGIPPQNERFFGGVRPRRFTEIPDWDLQTAPVIRGYPSGRFHARLAGDPSGHERFASLNLTAALTAWRRPLVPPEVYKNKGFLDAIKFAQDSSRATIEGYYEAQEPGMADVQRAANDLVPTLRALADLVGNLSPTDDIEDALEDCRDALRKALNNIRDKRFRALLVSAKVSGGLAYVIEQCEVTLNAELKLPEIRASVAPIDKARASIKELLDTRIRQDVVARKTDEDFAIVDRALTAFVHEMNLYSIDPVAIVDVAHVGSGRSDIFRYSVGGGLRLTLGSTASFMLGYAANPNRGPGEPRGAVVFELKIHDLIR